VVTALRFRYGKRFQVTSGVKPAAIEPGLKLGGLLAWAAGSVVP
jgi:hypothetical protein